MINPKWLQLPISRTNLHGHKGVRGIGIQLYLHVAIKIAIVERMLINNYDTERIRRVLAIR